MRGFVTFVTVWLVATAALAAPAGCPPPKPRDFKPAQWDVTAPPPGTKGPTESALLLLALNSSAPAPLAGDVADLCRYRAADRALNRIGGSVRVVLMGDSITDFWAGANPVMFADGIVDRGISGQLTWQMLVRFRQDVIDLQPRAVQILGGTNDLNGPPGIDQLVEIENNIQSMAELAAANHIGVILGTVPPMGGALNTPQKRARILALNSWISAYAKRNDFVVADYHALLETRAGALDPERSIDALHPNRRGYAEMESLMGVALARFGEKE